MASLIDTTFELLLMSMHYTNGTICGENVCFYYWLPSAAALDTALLPNIYHALQDNKILQ